MGRKQNYVQVKLHTACNYLQAVAYTDLCLWYYTDNDTS